MRGVFDRRTWHIDVRMKVKKDERTRTGGKSRTELPWNVILHNDWENSMPRVVLILKKTIPGMTFKKATKIMYEAHHRPGSGQAVPQGTRRALRRTPTGEGAQRDHRTGPLEHYLHARGGPARGEDGAEGKRPRRRDHACFAARCARVPDRYRKTLGLPQRKVSRIIASSMKSLKDRIRW